MVNTEESFVILYHNNIINSSFLLYFASNILLLGRGGELLAYVNPIGSAGKHVSEQFRNY